jgi:hypothetical protein
MEKTTAMLGKGNTCDVYKLLTSCGCLPLIADRWRARERSRETSADMHAGSTSYGT